MISEELLRSFCSRDPSRFILMDPFTLADGWTYATDGMVVIRVKGFEFKPGKDVTPPRVDKLQEWSSVPRTVVVDLPELPPPQRVACAECSGTGKLEFCRECNGRGVLECDMGHEHECTGCNGKTAPKPDAKCFECDGTGRVEAPAVPVRVGRMLLADVYLRKLAALPGLQLFDNGGTPSGAYFMFEGGEGIVMGMRE